MKKSDIKAEIIKALEGKEMTAGMMYFDIPLWIEVSPFLRTLSELTKSGEVIFENGIYKIKENNHQ